MDSGKRQQLVAAPSRHGGCLRPSCCQIGGGGCGRQQVVQGRQQLLWCRWQHFRAEANLKYGSCGLLSHWSDISMAAEGNCCADATGRSDSWTGLLRLLWRMCEEGCSGAGVPMYGQRGGYSALQWAAGCNSHLCGTATHRCRILQNVDQNLVIPQYLGLDSSFHKWVHTLATNDNRKSGIPNSRASQPLKRQHQMSKLYCCHQACDTAAFAPMR